MTEWKLFEYIHWTWVPHSYGSQQTNLIIFIRTFEISVRNSKFLAKSRFKKARNPQHRNLLYWMLCAVNTKSIYFKRYICQKFKFLRQFSTVAGIFELWFPNVQQKEVSTIFNLPWKYFFWQLKSWNLDFGVQNIFAKIEWTILYVYVSLTERPKNYIK